MAGREEGKVAFVTGAGRDEGRSHAVGLAEEGADIIAVDICQDCDTLACGRPSEADLAETVKEVEPSTVALSPLGPTCVTPVP
jgi:NAD(P)-dependent dehydrogenase (short-subunit alcohol dehydrogenase family)